MSKAKKWILGVAIILAALATAAVALLDNDPDTKVDPKGTIQEIQRGVEEIKKTEEVKSE